MQLPRRLDPFPSVTRQTQRASQALELSAAPKKNAMRERGLRPHVCR